MYKWIHELQAVVQVSTTIGSLVYFYLGFDHVVIFFGQQGEPKSLICDCIIGF